MVRGRQRQNGHHRAQLRETSSPYSTRETYYVKEVVFEVGGMRSDYFEVRWKVLHFFLLGLAPGVSYPE